MLSYSYQRKYCGKIQAVIFDWAGTTIDFGCIAPAVVFVQIFEQAGVPITMTEARLPMGTHKKEHIRQLLQMDSIKNRWQEKYQRFPTDDDVDQLFENFVPIQIDCLTQYASLIPGTLKVIEEIRARHYKIGSTSDYLRNMLEICLKETKKQGYQPDSFVAVDEVPSARPHPAMCLQNAINLEVSTLESCVKIDDTIPGIHEGLNAGMWTIGIALSGNEVGLSLEEFNSLSIEEKNRLRAHAYERLSASGAHYVVDTIADVMPCLNMIEARLAGGERP